MDVRRRRIVTRRAKHQARHRRRAEADRTSAGDHERRDVVRGSSAARANARATSCPSRRAGASRTRRSRSSARSAKKFVSWTSSNAAETAVVGESHVGAFGEAHVRRAPRHTIGTCRRSPSGTRRRACRAPWTSQAPASMTSPAASCPGVICRTAGQLTAVGPAQGIGAHAQQELAGACLRNRLADVQSRCGRPPRKLGDAYCASPPRRHASADSVVGERDLENVAGVLERREAARRFLHRQRQPRQAAEDAACPASAISMVAGAQSCATSDSDGRCRSGRTRCGSRCGGTRHRAPGRTASPW